MKINKPCLVLMGAAGAGKDTVANMINEYMFGTLTPESYRLRFSDPLKRVVSIMFGLDEKRMNELEYKETPFEKPIEVPELNGDHYGPEFMRTPRELLQWFGTDFGRGIDKNMWVKAAIREAADFQHSVDYYIATDCRFPNEQQAIKEVFSETLFVYLHRGGREVLTGETAKHASETQQLHFDRKYVVADGDRDGLRQLARILAKDFLHADE